MMNSVSLIHWLASSNQKDIGLAYVISALMCGVISTTLSALVRSELYESASRYDTASFAPDPLYPGLITAHAVFQILFMVMLALFGGNGNWMVPILIGSPYTAFPRLNHISFWLTLASMLAVVLSALPGAGLGSSGIPDAGWPGTGWTLYPPLS